MSEESARLIYKFIYEEHFEVIMFSSLGTIYREIRHDSYGIDIIIVHTETISMEIVLLWSEMQQNHEIN